MYYVFVIHAYSLCDLQMLVYLILSLWNLELEITGAHPFIHMTMLGSLKLLM